MSKKAIILLAEGFEEAETVTPITYLRRAGIEVTAVSISRTAAVKGARGVSINADITLADFSQVGAAQEGDDWDAVIIPGGLKGAENLAANEKVCKLIKDMHASGKLICAICVSPVRVLAPLGLLAGKKFTCYPGYEEEAKAAEGSSAWLEDRVVVDGKLITSRAAGTSGEFALAIIRSLLGEDAAKKVADAVLS